MRDVESLVGDLTLEEKALLTAGRDMWSTAAIERTGVPSVRMTDGPNGARGSSVLGAGEATAVCVPCGSALGATWDPELIERVAALLGEEARTKGCRILLAPTLNLHRSPLAGRNFECFSEDPLLAGRAAAAYVRGLQGEGVIATIKHLAGNETEFERYSIDSVVDERALRELYLVPFELAVTEGGALAVMTAYNRLNGRYCAEDRALLEGILRGAWGFEGFVMTDWFALASTERSPQAGLDLEMPGPGRALGPAVGAAVRDGRVPEGAVDAQVTRLLATLDRVGALDDEPDAPERSIDRPEHRALAREAAAAAMVLLRNDGLLPLDPSGLGSVAVIGPNAARATIMGGGSAYLRPHRRVTPLQALRERLGDRVEVRHERGCDIDRTAPVLESPFAIELHAGPELAGEPVARARRDDGLLVFFGAPAPGVDPDDFSFRARARLVPAESGPHAITIAQAGRARVLVDGAEIVEGFSDPPPRGEQLIGMVSEERGGTVELEAGREVEVVVEASSEGAPSAMRGVRVGLRAPAPPDLLDRAVAAAAANDAAIVVVGTNADWETEGADRAALELPGDQDELVRRVLAANPRTVVVVNAGAPVAVDWAQDAPALLVAWLGGQEMAGALADVLTGDAEPSGRLPTTFPERIEHTPAFGAFPGENGSTRYAESVLMGYRWYDARRLPVRFAFGQGLSYTTFAIGPPRLSADAIAAGDTVSVEADVTNTGARPGSEVVQLYVAPLAPPLVRPPKELKAFAKVRLDPGHAATVRLELGPRAFACWDPGDRAWPELAPRLAASTMAGYGAGRRTEGGWRIEPGRYELQLGRSCAEIAHVVPLDVVG
jgi:beta-glucosidase